MANKFQIKRTTVSGRTPNTSDPSNTSFIDVGELAVNIPDQKLFTSNGSVLIEIGSNVTNLSVTNTLTVNAISANGSTGSNGQVLLSNGSSVYWSDSSGALSFPFSRILVSNSDFGNLSVSFVDSFGVSFDQSYDCNSPGSFYVVDNEEMEPEKYGSRDFESIVVDATSGFDYGFVNTSIRGVFDIINFGANYEVPLDS